MMDARPCPYCWQPPCLDKHHGMETCPECDPPDGYAEIHPECEDSMFRYENDPEAHADNPDWMARHNA